MIACWNRHDLEPPRDPATRLWLRDARGEIRDGARFFAPEQTHHACVSHAVVTSEGTQIPALVMTRGLGRGIEPVERV